MTARTLAVAVVLLALLAPTAGADPALLARVERIATQYHEDPKALDPLRDEVTRAAEREPRVDLLITLARVSFIWGDVRATSADAKLEAYERGRVAARRAVDLERGRAGALCVAR